MVPTSLQLCADRSPHQNTRSPLLQESFSSLTRVLHQKEMIPKNDQENRQLQTTVRQKVLYESDLLTYEFTIVVTLLQNQATEFYSINSHSH